MTLDEINEQIAKLMQEKAEDQALAHYVAPRASSRFDYIINGDRSGLDKFDASEQAYANMLAKQRMANDEAYKQRMFNELSKEADRLNTMKVAMLNKDNQKDAKLFEIKKQLTNLLSEKNILEAQGKPTYTIDNTINTILEEYPQLKDKYSANKPTYDPRANPDYQLAKFSKVNAKNSYVEDIQEAIDELSKYQTPESARRLAELDIELELRKKADASGETLKSEIAAFNINNGDLSDYLTNQGYTVAKAGKIYKLLDKNGNVVKPTRRTSNNDNVNWD